MKSVATLSSLALAAAALVALTACESVTPAELIQLTDLTPRQLELGDRIEITGQNLPIAADIRRMSVTLRGVLARPGRAACSAPVDVTVSDPPAGTMVTDVATGQTREATYAESTSRILRLDGSNRIELVMTEGLLRELTHCPGTVANELDVPHATLVLAGGGPRSAPHGITIRIDGLTGSRAISGTLRGLTLDLNAPPARRQALEVAARPVAERALDFIGVDLATSHPAEGGLRVAAVRPGSPAERAGILSNDVLARIDGLSISAVPDFRPAPGAGSVVISVLRGDLQDDRALSLDGLDSTAPLDLLAAAVLLVVAMTVLGIFLLPRPSVLIWIRHAFVRGGSSRGRSARFLPWLYRGLLDAWRRGLLRNPSGDTRLALAPCLCIAAIASTILSVPFGHSARSLDADVGIVFAIAIVVQRAGALAARIGTSRSDSFLASIARTLRSGISSAPAIAALACAVFSAGTLHMQGIVASQGGSPWEWYAFKSPLSLLLLGLYGVTVVSLGGGDAVAELESERNVGWRLAGSSLEWCCIFALCAVGAVVFLGGWQVPGVSFAEHDASVFMQMSGSLLFMLKTWTLLFAVLWARWCLAAEEIAVLAVRAWRYLVAGVVVGCAGTVAWLAVLPGVPGFVQSALAAATFALSCIWVLTSAVRGLLADGARREIYLTSPFA